MITTANKTATRLLGQWQENTGKHFLDSGGAYGRNWERNQAKTLESFTESPEITIEDNYGDYPGYVTVNTFQYLLKHLEVTADSEHLTSQFRAYVDSQPVGEAYYNSLDTVETWLESVGAEPAGYSDDTSGFNTYNWENSLDSVLMGAMFKIGDVTYTVLSYHGGADVRGGYSDFVIYESCSCWMYSTEDNSLVCSNSECDVWLDLRDGGDQNGTDKDITLGQPCPECGSDFTGYTSDCMGDF